MDKEQKQTHPEVGEDATQYGEFVSSYFAWISLPKQKEKAEEMADMTKNEKKTRPQIREKKTRPQIREKKDRPQITKEEK